jgi:N-acetylmuramoyl-L-alanine amidase
MPGRKLYLLAGHSIINGKGTGVHSKHGDEAVTTRNLVTDIARYLYSVHGIMAITDSDSWNLPRVVRWMVGLCRPNDILIDFHFNAFNGKAHGTEGFVPKKHTAKEFKLMLDLVKAVSDATGIVKRNPPVKTEDQSQHSRLAILSQPYQAINGLIEICFIDNADDMNKFNRNYKDLVELMGEVIAEHYFDEHE